MTFPGEEVELFDVSVALALQLGQVLRTPALHLHVVVEQNVGDVQVVLQELEK